MILMSSRQVRPVRTSTCAQPGELVRFPRWSIGDRKPETLCHYRGESGRWWDSGLEGSDIAGRWKCSEAVATVPGASGESGEFGASRLGMCVVVSAGRIAAS